MGWSCGTNGRLRPDKESRRPEIGGEKEARKTEIVMGDCIKRDLERLGEELRKRATDRRNWRLLKENVVREK